MPFWLSEKIYQTQKSDPDLLKKLPVVFIGTHENGTSSIAKVVLPSLTNFEKSGTFINRSFYAQSFKQAVPGPPGVLPDLHILNRLLNGLVEDSAQTSELPLIWDQMRQIPKFLPKGSIIR